MPLGSVPSTGKKKNVSCQVWWHTLVIPVLGRLRQEDHRFKDSLSNLGPQ